MNRLAFASPLFLAALALAAPPGTTQPASSPDAPTVTVKFAGQVLGNIDKTNFPEPSGCIFHPTRKTLFVIGDGGDICEMNTDGAIVRKKHYPATDWPMDLEGITVNPATGLLYVAVEGAEAILEVNPDDLAIKRTFQIERTLDGRTVMAAGGQGIEGITFVPNPKHPHGGTFLVANQAFTLSDPKDCSAIFEVEVPLAEKAAKPPPAKLLRHMRLPLTDLADLHYDAARDRLYVVSDDNDLLLVMTLDGRIRTRYTNLPCADQEGLAFDDAGHLYIAQDSGGVVRIKWQDK